MIFIVRNQILWKKLFKKDKYVKFFKSFSLSFSEQAIIKEFYTIVISSSHAYYVY